MNERKKILNRAAKAARSGARPTSSVRLPARLAKAENEAFLSAFFGWKRPEDALLALAASELRASVRETLARREAGFYWANIAQALKAGAFIPGTDIPRCPARLCYPVYDGTAERSAHELARSWSEDAPRLGKKLRRRVEATLKAAGAFGQTILAGREPVYRVSGGLAEYRAQDGKFYSSADVEEMLHDAAPWSRAELMEQFRQDAERLGGAAAEFYGDLAGLLGPQGQSGMEIPAATPVELEGAARQARLLIVWISARLGVQAPAIQPVIRPVTADIRQQIGGAGLLGAHDETDAIYLASGFSRYTLVHELVHWVLTHSGERARRNLGFEAEEALAHQLAELATRRRR